MPTLDWLDRERALKRADEVPYRLLESVSSHGDPNAGNLLIQGDNRAFMGREERRKILVPDGVLS